ncbi:MAG: sigma factor [Acidobacteriota bacterium]
MSEGGVRRKDLAAYEIDACLRGDAQAWEAFVKRYAPVIYRAVSRTMLGRRTDARGEDIKDVTQEVFYRLVRDDYRLLRSYDPSRSSLVTWLTIVSRSLTLDGLRKKACEAVPLDLRSGETPVEPPGCEAAAEYPSDLLTARQRLVMHLLYEKDMEVRDVARLLGIDEQSVRSARHKALLRLREHFGVKRAG